MSNDDYGEVPINFSVKLYVKEIVDLVFLDLRSVANGAA